MLLEEGKETGPNSRLSAIGGGEPFIKKVSTASQKSDDEPRIQFNETVDRASSILSQAVQNPQPLPMNEQHSVGAKNITIEVMKEDDEKASHLLSD